MNLDSLIAQRDRQQAEAESILTRAGGADLDGDDAARFDELTEQIEAANSEIREIRQRADAGREVARRAVAGHTEGGSVGTHYIGERAQISARGDLSPLFPSAANLAKLEEARRDMTTLSVIETRAALTTSDMGTATEYGPNGLLAPRTLWRASGIPTTEPPAGYAAVTPQFTLPAGTALVAEGAAHAEFSGVNPDAVTIRRTGAWSDLTSEAMLSTALGEISTAHARVIARDLDKAAVAKIDQAPTAIDLDEALVTVASECACDVSDLWIVGNPPAVSALVGVASAMTPTSGSDVASYATRYGGAALYVTAAATAAQLTVFHPGSFRAFSTPLATAVVIDPKTGSQTFGSWQFFGLGQSLVGSAVTVGVS